MLGPIRSGALGHRMTLWFLHGPSEMCVTECMLRGLVCRNFYWIDPVHVSQGGSGKWGHYMPTVSIFIETNYSERKYQTCVFLQLQLYVLSAVLHFYMSTRWINYELVHANFRPLPDGRNVETNIKVEIYIML